MSIQSINHPIDIVISWVDGCDQQWLDEKAKYVPETYSDTRVSRYRDWDNLHYVFRGIEEFAPWVNKVFFVTWGHLPTWLNTEHPKLRVINHRDYIPSEYLPTFNANVIELNFHRIKELSENFVYFNDDMFLLKKTGPELFFMRGKPCDSAILTAHSHNETEPFMSLQYRATGIINKYFKVKEVLRKNRRGWHNLKYGKMLFRSLVLSGFPRFTGFWQHHMPYSLQKSTLLELWEKEYVKFHHTCQSRFRSALDFNIWVFRNWQLASGNFHPRSISVGKSFAINNEISLNEVALYIEKQKGKMICINDSEIGWDEFVIAKERLIESFDRILPRESSFEK